MKTVFTSTLLVFCLTSAAGHSNPVPPDSLKPVKRAAYRASTPKQNDLIHTRLDVKFDWNTSQMEGRASITAKPYFKPTSHLDLNARGMEIRSVEVYDISSAKPQPKMTVTDPEMPGTKKMNTSYKYVNDSIKIELGRVFNANENYLVKINYVAKPNELKQGGSDAISDDKGLFFINPKGEEKNKMPQIWTQGETQASSAWFPTIDSPNEKMTSEIYMTVDEKYTTLSNGLLSSTKKNTDGTKTDHWKMDLPHSPYLVMMAVGEFKKVTDNPWNGKEISYYVEKEYEPHAKAIFGNTKEMIDFFSKVLGVPYPWQKYSQIVVRDYVSGAMENTSATLHGDFMVYQTTREIIDGKKGEDVISHELFHQWFGDLVTAESWSNLPLNESFATYGEYLWQEYKNGRDAADAHSYQSRMGYYAAAQEKQVSMIRFEYNHKEDMFDAWSYNKGGQILHMLRKYTGDQVFFAALKLYLERNRFKNAELHDLRLAFEEISGEDMNWFFNEWFFAKGHPELQIEKSYNASQKTITLKVRQKQDLKENPLYILPVDIDIYFAGKKERHRVTIEDQEQEFVFQVPSQPDLVNFDAERQLLAIRNYSKTTEEFIFQYKNAPLFSDRQEALVNLKKQIEQPEVYSLFLLAAENDKWHEIRELAIQSLKPVAKAKEADLKPFLVKIASADNNTNTKAQAIRFLSENYRSADLDELYKKAINEQSYAILSASLKGIMNTDPAFALQKAKELEKEKPVSVFVAISEVYATIGSDENNSYFLRSRENFSGYGYLTYIYYYGSFLQRCSKPATFESAAAVFMDILKTENDYVKQSARKDYEEFLLGGIKSKVEDLKKSNAPEHLLKEWENTGIKLVDLLKSV